MFSPKTIWRWRKKRGRWGWSPNRLRDRRATVRYPVIKRNRFRHDVDGNRRSVKKFLAMRSACPPIMEFAKTALRALIWFALSSLHTRTVILHGAIKSSIYNGNSLMECRHRQCSRTPGNSHDSCHLAYSNSTARCVIDKERFLCEVLVCKLNIVSIVRKDNKR